MRNMTIRVFGVLCLQNITTKSNQFRRHAPKCDTDIDFADVETR